MSIYGSLNKQIVENSEVFDIDSIQESMDLASDTIAVSERVIVPQEMKVTVDDFHGSSAALKTKYEKVIKYMKDNGAKDKEIAKQVYFFYYAIIGNTFDGQCKKYDPKMGWYIAMANKYCDDKQRSKIKKDMEKTIVALDKMKDQGKTLSELQKAYYKDISANVGKIK